MKIVLALLSVVIVSAQEQKPNLFITAGCQHEKNGCIGISGSCFISHPNTCRKYVWCNMMNNQAYEMLCPRGTFFDELKGRCLHSHMVDCKHDLCKTQDNLFSYKDEYETDCKYYWTCREDRRSYPACCQGGSRFVEGQGCVKDLTCLGRCDSQHVCTRPEPTHNCRMYWNCTEDKNFDSVCCPRGQGYNSTLQKCVNDISCTAECPKVCPSRPVPGNNKMFMHGGEKKMCPKGTRFDYSECQCVTDEQTKKEGCDVTVDIDFMGQRNINSLIYVDYKPEALKNGSGIGNFDGKSYLAIPYFMDGKAIDTLFLHLEFKGDDSGEKRQVLVSNCKTKETNQASFQVLLDKEQNVLLVLGYTYESFKVLQVAYEPNQWNELEVEFDGSELKVKVTPEIPDVTKEYEGEDNLKGKLRKSQMPLNFGACLNAENKEGEIVDTYFNGRMRNIKLYTDCLPKPVVPIAVA